MKRAWGHGSTGSEGRSLERSEAQCAHTALPALIPSQREGAVRAPSTRTTRRSPGHTLWANTLPSQEQQPQNEPETQLRECVSRDPFFPIRFLAYYVAETVLKVKFEGHGFQAGL